MQNYDFVFFLKLKILFSALEIKIFLITYFELKKFKFIMKNLVKDLISECISK